MPEAVRPGVAIQESGGPPPITGVSTIVAAMLGPAERGPVAPCRVRRADDYARMFGGPVAGTWLAQAVQDCFANGGRHLVVCRVVGAGATVASVTLGGLIIRASGPGAWGNQVAVRIAHDPDGRVDMTTAYWPDAVPPGDPFGEGQPPAQILEEWPGLLATSDGEPVAPDLALIGVEWTPDGRGVAPPAGVHRLAGGADGNAPGLDDYRGLPTQERAEPQGLAALDASTFDDVAVVHAPAAPTEVAAAVVADCARRRDRFAVVDGTAAIVADARRAVGDSAFGACYWPWVTVSDGVGGARSHRPPGGAVVGIYGRVDIERSVFTAPASEGIAGALDVAEPITAVESSALLQRGVNPIQRFPGRGVRVWGARTLSSDPEWRYVNVRRYAIYLEQSMARGTAWAVFEPGTPETWARVRSSVEQFLTLEWRNGGLCGNRPEQAFFVRCDASTMTADDIAAGRLVCTVGLAMLRPAEFIVLRVGHQGQPA